jgi:hypothetical protein
MYLEAEMYIRDIKKFKILFPKIKDIKNIKGFTVTIQVGYWIKANAIHNWFVENIQEGKDECQRSYVNRDQLKELLKVCQDVLKDVKKADTKLPTAEGFFFGSTEYGDMYFSDIKDTINIIQICLKLPKKTSSFYYQSSW